MSLSVQPDTRGSVGPDERRWAVGRIPAIALVLLAGLLLRLVIAYVLWPGQGLTNDLLLLEGWAQALADHGPAGFYGNTPLADYPPGYLWVLWIEGLLGNAIAGVLGQAPADVIAALHKLPAIGADLLIAFLLYKAARQWRNQTTGLAAAALYLFNPVTSYNSALWGQVDSVGALLLLGSILLLIYNWSEPAVAVAVLAAVTKPQYAIGLAIVGAILLRRHLLQPGSGPLPTLGPRLAQLDARLGGRLRSWLAGRQGPERLLGCALVAFVVFFAAILPFDLPALTSNDLADIPLVGHVAGLVALVSTLAAAHDVLTANAFNFWALVGPTPLTHALNNNYMWTYESLTVLGPLSAASVGGLLLVLVGVVTVFTLLVRDDRQTILIAFTVLAVAFFALPTRAHERYLFPAFATGALLAATSIRWRWWFVVLGLLNVANLHAILTMPVQGYATAGLVDLFPGRLLRDDAAVTLISVGHTVAFGVLFVAFARLSVWPAIRDLRQTGWTGIWRTRPPSASPTGSKDLVVETPRAGWKRASVPAAPASADARAAPIADLRASIGRLGRHFRSLVARAGAGLQAPHLTPRSADAAVAEPGGRLDRKDLAVFALLVAVTFGTRAWRLELPRTEYFDEYWHATTATEFLQDWRYGIPHTISEWTHPHLAKYAMAASVAAFGDNTARSADSLGTPVRDAVLAPARLVGGNPGGLVGDQLIVVTGADVRIAPHGKLDAAVVVPLQGASTVATDPARYRAFVGTDDGAIYLLNGPSLEAAATFTPRPQMVAGIGVPIIHLWVAGTDRLIAQSPGDQIRLLDASNGSVLATAHLGGISGLLPVTTSNGSQFAIASIPSGLVELDLTSLRSVATLSLPAPPFGLDLVDGSDQGKRERELLLQPTLYVATGAARVETVLLGADGTLQPAGGFPMPGPVTDVRWDRTTNLVHVLGTTRDGGATIYVVDPHSNAVFADAALPFNPAVWLLDVEPGAPSLDRQRAVAFSANGEIQTVDVGNNAFAWRLPGVAAGALMAGLLYLLTRVLFRRRLVGLLVAATVPAEGLLFAQSRIAMNDAYVGLFIVAAFTLLAHLLQSRASGWRVRLELILGLPALGVLLGLAFASKWVALYAMGGVVLLVLLRSPVGRWLAFAGLMGMTTVFGYLAVADSPPNFTFFLVMLVLVALFAIAMARRGTTLRSLRHEPIEERWVEPRWRRGLPFGWALACLTILPLAVYVASYVPWAIGTAGGPQLLAGWPPGHTGQTFLDLQAQMYSYHNELRAPHGASSPWWAWPLDLKPIWGYLEGFVDGTQASILGTGNVVLLWLAIPAVAFGAWQAWRRRSTGLAFVAVAFLCLWLPWARIDRVAYNYHYYVALPFALVLLAYFLAELWDGPSAWTWLLARVAAVAVLLGPAVLWIWRTPLCALAGVDAANPGSPVCAEPVSAFAAPVIGWLIGAVIAGVFVWRLRRPRWLVGGIVAAATVTFLVLYPALAAWRVPDGVAWVYQGLLPSWDSSFYFNNNEAPVAVIPLLTGGLLAVLVVTGLVAAGAMRLASGWGRPPPDGPVARLRSAMAGRDARFRSRAVTLQAPASEAEPTDGRPLADMREAVTPRFLALVGGLTIVAFSIAWWLLHQPWWLNYSEYFATGSDPRFYQYVGESVMGGLLPYRDFPPTYPPAALPLFVIPSLLGPDYRGQFEALMLLIGWLTVIVVLLTLARLGAGRGRIVLLMAFIGVSPLLVGQLMTARFDLWPSLLMIAALLAVVAGRFRLGSATLGVAIMAKIYPVVLVPLVVAYVWRSRSRREAVISAALVVGSAAIVALPFLLLTPTGFVLAMFDFVQWPLQRETLGAAMLFVASNLAGAPVIVNGAYIYEAFLRPTADAIATLQLLVLGAVLTAVWAAFARGPADRNRLLTAAAAAVCAFVTFGKALSPQYLIWLVPLVPLVGGRRGIAATAVLAAALAITQMYMPGRWFDWVAGRDPDAASLVLARDLTLVVLLGVLSLPAGSTKWAANARAYLAQVVARSGRAVEGSAMSAATMAGAIAVGALALTALTVVYQVLTTERLTIREGCGFDGGQYCAMAAGQLALEPFNRRILLPFIVGQIGPPGADGFALVNGFIIAACLCAFAYLAVMNGGRAKARLVGLVIALASLIFLSNRNTWHLYLSHPALSDFLALLFLVSGCIALVKMSNDNRWSLVAAAAAFGGALSRENLALILAAAAVFAAATKTVRWRGVLPILGAGLAGTIIAFSQPALTIEHQTVFGVLAEWIGKDFGDAEGFLRFAVMFVLGVGPFAVVCFLWPRQVWRDTTGRMVLATAIIFMAVSVFAGGDTDRILMPAGLLFGICVLRLFLTGVIPFGAVILLVCADWIWQLPFVPFSGDQYEWLTFWGFRVTPLGDVLRYGLVPILVGVPLVLAAVRLRSPSETVALSGIEG